MLQTLLQRRSNGYYYFRWVCPPAIRKLLGKREIIKSLRTTSKMQALARAGAYYRAVDGLKDFCVQVSTGAVDIVNAGEDLDAWCSKVYQLALKTFDSFLNLSEEYGVCSLKDAQEKLAKFGNIIEFHKKAGTNHFGGI